MKTALVLLLSIIALFPIISLAETMVQKPNLPANYEKWPYSLSDSCTLDNKNVYAISAYGKIDPTTNTLEFVRIRTINNTPIYIWYVKGIAYSQMVISYAYLPKANQWTELNLKTADYRKVLPIFDAILKEMNYKKGMDDVLITCRQIENKSDTYFYSLQFKASEK